MLGIDKEIARVAQERPTAERLKGLKRIIPRRVIKSILKRTNQNRACKRLPKEVMVWFVVAMGLFAATCYRQVFRRLQPFRAGLVPPRSTLCEARQRLGVAPLFWLVQHVIRLLATQATPQAFYAGMRLMAIDGFVVDLFDNESLVRVFGRPRGSRADGAFPQARILALCEVGTHVLWKYLVKPIRRAEIVMAKTLLRYLDATMLLLWDRGFLSYQNVCDLLARKANLLARIKMSMVFRKIKVLRDGSYQAKLYRSAHDRAKDREGVLVRIIEYTINDSARTKKKERRRFTDC